MREFNVLAGYPQPKEPRYVSPDLRTIKHRIVASYRGPEFYDGDRNYGYGGLKYDGRWVPIAKNIIDEYKLSSGSKVLQIGSDKGFLLNDLALQLPGLEVHGLEVSAYAIENTLDSVKPNIKKGSFRELPFELSEFDLVIAIGAVYTLNLEDAISCLREIDRVSKGRAFITLGSYETEEEYWLFKAWSLLGCTILKPDEWRQVLEHAGYRGDYTFVGAKSLNLQRAPEPS